MTRFPRCGVEIKTFTQTAGGCSSNSVKVSLEVVAVLGLLVLLLAGADADTLIELMKTLGTGLLR